MGAREVTLSKCVVVDDFDRELFQDYMNAFCIECQSLRL
jgi:hypothetical protein